MKINKILESKALPSFCTANTDVLNSIMFYCYLKKLPCLIECTSNQVNQSGGYTKKTPKDFMNLIYRLKKKYKLSDSQLFIGGDHLGPLPWKNQTSKIALKNSVILIDNFLKQKFDKIHIDTSIKCKDDKFLNNEIIFQRTNFILDKVKKNNRIKKKFLVIGTEVPLSGSDNNKNVILTSKKQIENESFKFRKILKSTNLKKNRKFGLVVEPGMKYMHSTIKKPNLKKFTDKKIFSKKNNFVFEAHSTDYQPKAILRELVKNNFKFLKVGPELTYNYSRSLFLMEKIEKKLFIKKKSNIKESILFSMKKNKSYWENYYGKKDQKLFLNSKLDRMRYYFNMTKVHKSIEILKKNINNMNFKEILKFIDLKFKKDFLIYNKKKISNFDNIKLIYISRSLKRYFLACGYKIN